MPKARPSSERIDYLDSIRGLAALNVMLGHFFGAYGDPRWLAGLLGIPPFAWIGDGSGAVSLFFVLSGFVLVVGYFYPARREFHIREEILPYVVGRIVRIGLPFVGAVMLTYFAGRFFPNKETPLLPMTSWAKEMLPEGGSFFGAARQFLLFAPAEGKQYLPQAWTLDLELFASMLVPFFLLALIRSDLAAALLMIVLLRKHWYLLHFFLGMITAKYLPLLLKRGPALSPGYKILILAAAALPFSFRVIFSLVKNEGLVWLINGGGAWLLLLFVFLSPGAQNFLRAKPLLFLGRISYSLYLVHFVVVVLLAPYFLRAIVAAGVSGESLAYFGMFVACTAGSVILAAIYYRLVEGPTVKLSHVLKKALLKKGGAV